MRRIILSAFILLAACGKGGGDDNQQAAANATEPAPKGPPPLTPTMNVADLAAGNDSWMQPSDNAGDPAHAPYGNLLDQPLVDAPKQR